MRTFTSITQPDILKHYYFLFIATTLLFGCTTQRKSIKLDAIEVSSANSEYRKTAEIVWDILHTDVALSFNMAKKEAEGNVAIIAKPHFYPTDELILDAKSMEIHSVQMDGMSIRYRYEQDSLIINTGRKLSNDTISIAIRYTAKPYANPSGGSKAIREDRGLYFINTDLSTPGKPVQIWTQGETEANSHWVPTIDKPNQRFTTSITLTIPDSFTTLSNGMLVSQKTDNNLRTDRWEMNQVIQPYVMMFAIGNYRVIEDEPWNDIKVNYYVEPKYAEYAKGMFQHTTEMIDFFSKVTHTPYPWNKYSQVVVRDYVSGAMENTSASVFGEFKNATTRELKDDPSEDVVAHELFHQWFGDYVTAESWSNITLNESFATFGEQLWRRHKYGQVSEQISAYQDIRSYLSSEDHSPSLVRNYYNSKEDVFDRVSYQKGATILRYMEGLMGSTAFNLAMKEYLSANANSPAEADHWRLAVEKVTGQDWHPFFNQWYHKGGHPELSFKYKYDDNDRIVHIDVEQKQQLLYELPLLIEVISGSERRTHTINVKNRDNSFSFPYPATNRPIVLPDVMHSLPGKIEESKSADEWYQHYKATGKDDYISKLNAITSNYKKLNNETIQKLYRAAMSDPIPEIRSAVLDNMIASEDKSLKNFFSDRVTSIAKEDTSSLVRASALRLLTYWKIKEALNLYYKYLNDSSYSVVATALYGLYDLDKDTTYTIAQKLANQNPGRQLLPAVWDNIAVKGNAADTSLLVDVPYMTYSKRKIDYVAALSLYMQKVNNDDAFSAALEKASIITETENISSYRSAMAAQIVEAAFFYKQESNASTKRATAANPHSRYSMLKKSLLYLENKETDEDNLKEYDRLRKVLLKD